MGAKFSFTCPGCGYETIASGGPDCGMRTKTATIICLDCKELRDAVTVELFADPDDREKRSPVCERNATHRVRRWRAGGPCPKCGTAVPRGALYCLWD